MKKGMIILLGSILVGACATATQTAEPNAPTAKGPKITDEETYRVCSEKIEEENSCACCALAEQEKELEEISQQILRKS